MEVLHSALQGERRRDGLLHFVPSGPNHICPTRKSEVQLDLQLLRRQDKLFRKILDQLAIPILLITAVQTDPTEIRRPVLTEDANAIPPDVTNRASTILVWRSADAERHLVATAGNLEIVVGERRQAGLNEAKTASECSTRVKFKEFVEAAELWLLAVLALRIEEHLVSVPSRTALR